LDTLYNIHLRAGILAYVQEDYAGAIEHFQSAGPARPTDGMQGNFDPQKAGLHGLLVCSQRKEPAWYPGIADAVKIERDRLLLRLADTYLHAQRPEKAEAIYRRFLASGPKTLQSDPAAESYSRMQLALTLSQDGGNTPQSIELYKSFYRPEQSGYPWAADAILMLGVLIQNTTRSPKEALAHFEYVYTKYPGHPEAERAMYFHCVGASWTEDKDLVRAVSEKFLQKYPRSQWQKAVQAIKARNNQ
jgi:tetratricopeptide (TPR) repeat protein